MFERNFRYVEDAIGLITTIALLLMMTLITVDSIGRYVFRATLVHDVYHFTELFLMPVVVFFALSQTQRARGHVNVTLLTQFFPPRGQSLCTGLIYLAAFVAFAVITWVGWGNAWSHLINWRVTGGVVPWPTGISRVIVPIGAGVLTIRLLFDAITELKAAVSRPSKGGDAV